MIMIMIILIIITGLSGPDVPRISTDCDDLTGVRAADAPFFATG